MLSDTQFLTRRIAKLEKLKLQALREGDLATYYEHRKTVDKLREWRQSLMNYRHPIVVTQNVKKLSASFDALSKELGAAAKEGVIMYHGVDFGNPDNDITVEMLKKYKDYFPETLEVRELRKIPDLQPKKIDIKPADDNHKSRYHK